MMSLSKKIGYIKENPRAWQTLEKLKAKILAMTPYIYMVSEDETRVLSLISRYVANPLKKRVVIWSCYRGLLDGSGGHIEENQSLRNLPSALEWISGDSPPNQFSGTLYIMLDAHPFISIPVARQLRDMYVSIMTGSTKQKTTMGATKNILFLSGRLAHMSNGITSGLEPSLQTEVDVIDFPLPSREELGKSISSIVSTASKAMEGKNTSVKMYNPEEIEGFARALQGLTKVEALRAVSECFREKGFSLSVPSLLEKKKQVVKRDDVMEIIDSPPPMDQVGGLENIKEYVEMYRNQFSQKAEKFGVQPIRGLLIIGVCGTGKSLIAKAIASYWQLPCLRLDLGRVFSGIVGNSEQKIRKAIRVCEAVAPALLFLDEAEKQMSGTKSSNFSDAGTASRVFGTLLTAMEEGLKGVVSVATCNDISSLPPELIRRFDEVFFVDLPSAGIREDIFKIHLAKRKQSPEKFDLEELVKVTNRFTGSEIEKIVKQGIAKAFSRDEQLGIGHMLESARETRPISSIMKEQIKELRDWAKDRARPAHKEDETTHKFMEVNPGLSVEDIVAKSVVKKENDESIN